RYDTDLWLLSNHARTVLNFWPYNYDYVGGVLDRMITANKASVSSYVPAEPALVVSKYKAWIGTLLQLVSVPVGNGGVSIFDAFTDRDGNKLQVLISPALSLCGPNAYEANAKRILLVEPHFESPIVVELPTRKPLPDGSWSEMTFQCVKPHANGLECGGETFASWLDLIGSFGKDRLLLWEGEKAVVLPADTVRARLRGL
ncbi:MAG: hypothetical protein EBT61_22600, partial [Verrucomicrobia bacterium]|nr:hypothetical protein [Verrucomicrobiota bacterium]